MGVAEPEPYLAWRTGLVLVPPGIAAVTSSVEPALLGAGILVAFVSLVKNPAVRAVAGGLAIGVLSGPGLELPAVWLSLVAATFLTGGPRRIGMIPALVGLIWSLTWGVDPSHWPISCSLAALAAAAVGADAGTTIPILLLLAGLGGTRAYRIDTLVDEGTAVEGAQAAERFGAAWLAPRALGRLEREGWFEDGTRVRDQARLLGELGAPRLALRALGTEPMPTWERAALLNQAGRTVPAMVLGLADGPDTPVESPGVVFERTRWADGERIVLPVWSSGRTSQLVVRARGQVMLGFPRLEVSIAGTRLGPLDVAEEGGEWTLPVSLGPGVHRLVVDYPNPYTNHQGRKRLLTDVVVELR